MPAEGTQAGFDPEIAEALCKAMRRSCTVEPLAFGTLLEKMRRGELDMIVAGLAKNEQRLAYMDFTNSYYHSRSIYLGLPGNALASRIIRSRRSSSGVTGSTWLKSSVFLPMGN